MPKIPTYDAPGLALHPSDRGVTGTVNAARRVARASDEGAAAADRVAAGVRRIGSETEKLGAATAREGAAFGAGRVAVDFQQHREISAGNLEATKTIAGLTQTWENAVKQAADNPNDTSVGPKFQEEVLEPALAKLSEGFMTEGGQKWAESHTASIRNHFYTKTAADMSTLAGLAVQKNINESTNIATNTAMTDPSSVPFLLKTTDENLHAQIESSPNLQGKAAVKMELSAKASAQIVKAGAIGDIRKAADPEKAAENWAKRYPQYISGMEVKQLADEAKRESRARRVDQEHGIILQEKEATRVSDKRETEYLQKLYSDNPQDQTQVSAKAIVGDPQLTRPAKERMVNVVNRELKPETDAKISAQTSVGLFRQIADPSADPQKVRAAIMEARAKDPGTPGSLNKADFAEAMKNLEDVKTPQGAALAQDRNEFFKRFAATVDPAIGSTGQHSALGSQKMYEAEKAARRAEADAKAKGQDPHSIYDPSSPNYFAKQISRFRPTLQEINNYQSGLEKAVRMEQADRETKFTPPASWLYSPSRNQYRDPATMKVYGLDGKEVK